MDYAQADTPEVLCYAKSPPKTDRIYSMMMAWNVIGMFVTFGLAVTYLNAIGDAYGPMVGMFFGIPASVVAVSAFGLPTLAYLLNRGRKLARSQALILAVISFVPTALPPVMTILLITMPRTHGSGC